MRLQVQVDARGLLRSLDDVGRRQIPFATAKALTATAEASRVAVTRSLPQVFDRPTPFTMRGIAIRAARKTHLEAEVFVRPIQAGYLALEETGGTRSPDKGRAFVIPKAAARNAYGNLPKGALQAAKRRKDTFVGTPPGGRTGGFFRRLASGKLQPIALFISHAVYQPRFGFQERVTRTVQASFPAAFAEAFRNALATARR